MDTSSIDTAPAVSVLANPLAATAENWGVVNQMYAQEIGRQMRESKISRSQAIHLASEVIGGSMTPPLSGADFRKWISSNMAKSKPRAMHPAASAARIEPKHKAKQADWVMQEIGLNGGEQAADDDLGPRERARRLLKGMVKGEARFEVCSSSKEARSIQTALKKVLPEMHWRADNPYHSKILPNKVYQAGQGRVLLGVQRL